MSIRSNQSFEGMLPIEKARLIMADFAAPGGALPPSHAKQFITESVKSAKVLRMANVFPIPNPEHDIPRISYRGRRVLQAGSEGQALSDAQRQVPDPDGERFSAKLIRGEVPVSEEVYEDTIEREGFKDTLLKYTGEAVGRDLDDLIINGDTASADSFFAKLDGMLKLATANVVSNSGAAIDPDFLTTLEKLVPDDFMNSPEGYAFLTAKDAVTTYRNVIGERGTAAGDRYLLERPDPMFHGMPVVAIPNFPTNLGGGNNETNILLVEWANLAVAFYRGVKMRLWEDPRSGTVYVLIKIRVDFKYQVKDAVAKGTGVLV